MKCIYPVKTTIYYIIAMYSMYYTIITITYTVNKIITKIECHSSLISRKLCTTSPGVHPTSTLHDICDQTFPCFKFFVSVCYGGRFGNEAMYDLQGTQLTV